jgi:excisionase family DNA binding protein
VGYCGVGVDDVGQVLACAGLVELLHCGVEARPQFGGAATPGSGSQFIGRAGPVGVGHGTPRQSRLERSRVGVAHRALHDARASVTDAHGSCLASVAGVPARSTMTPTPPADEPEDLNVEEVAARLKLKEKTIRDWILRGDLPAYKLGKEWRIRRDHFVAPLGDQLRNVAGAGDQRGPCRAPERCLGGK